MLRAKIIWLGNGVRPQRARVVAGPCRATRGHLMLSNMPTTLGLPVCESTMTLSQIRIARSEGTGGMSREPIVAHGGLPCPGQSDKTAIGSRDSAVCCGQVRENADRLHQRAARAPEPRGEGVLLALGWCDAPAGAEPAREVMQQADAGERGSQGAGELGIGGDQSTLPKWCHRVEPPLPPGAAHSVIRT